ncbi:MAG: heat-inducible transcriptional repressor HrcA [Ignavibacteria bacterium]|jgi:heat-inducible transcriptional repressor
MNTEYIHRNSNDRDLNEREKSVLRSIVQSYILTASPVGSRFLSKTSEEFTLSPATIRNVMADLEDLNFISHPHTSAGRVPTDKGYRCYVDTLMDVRELSEKDRHVVKDQLQALSQDQALKDASRILGALSHCLAIVELPQMLDINVKKAHLVPLSSNRLLIVMELDSNIVRTVTLETDIVYDSALLDHTTHFINSRISGKSIRFLRDHIVEMMMDGTSGQHSLLRLFIDSVDTLLSPHVSSDEKVHIAGARHLLEYPEFDSPNQLKGVIELVENEDVIIHLLDHHDDLQQQSVKIVIGNELKEEKLHEYSLVMGSYTMKGAHGSIGLIGPKRMNYAKMVSLVQYMGQVLSQSG